MARCRDDVEDDDDEEDDEAMTVESIRLIAKEECKWKNPNFIKGKICVK